MDPTSTSKGLHQYTAASPALSPSSFTFSAASDSPRRRCRVLEPPVPLSSLSGFLLSLCFLPVLLLYELYVLLIALLESQRPHPSPFFHRLSRSSSLLPHLFLPYLSCHLLSLQRSLDHHTSSTFHSLRYIAHLIRSSPLFTLVYYVTLALLLLPVRLMVGVVSAVLWVWGRAVWWMTVEREVVWHCLRGEGDLSDLRRPSVGRVRRSGGDGLVKPNVSGNGRQGGLDVNECCRCRQCER